MTKAEKNRLLLWNSIIWIAAMVLPFVLNLTLGSTKFPWPMLLPLLLIGFLLYSNNVLSKVIGEPTDSATTGTTAKI
jgi:fatty acid desaturase